MPGLSIDVVPASIFLEEQGVWMDYLVILSIATDRHISSFLAEVWDQQRIFFPFDWFWQLEQCVVILDALQVDIKLLVTILGEHFLIYFSEFLWKSVVNNLHLLAFSAVIVLVQVDAELNRLEMTVDSIIVAKHRVGCCQYQCLADEHACCPWFSSSHSAEGDFPYQIVGCWFDLVFWEWIGPSLILQSLLVAKERLFHNTFYGDYQIYSCKYYASHINWGSI